MDPAGAKRQDLKPRLRHHRAAGKPNLATGQVIGNNLRVSALHKQDHAYSSVSYWVPSKAAGNAARARRASTLNSAS